MIYGYKINNGAIEYLGASDEQERLIKALELAGINTEGLQFTDIEPIMAGGKYFLSADDDEYKAIKKKEETEARIASMQPTLEERLEAMEQAFMDSMAE